MAEIICVGTELVLGQILNTNAQWLSRRLSELGIDVYYHTAVGDNVNRFKEIVTNSLDRSDLIITTGGLGPTQDDLTKETVAEVLQLRLVLNPEILKNIKCFFSRIDKKMSHNNEKQAYIPEGAQVLPNDMGTAPGIIVEKGQKTIIMLPGPPHEMKNMFKKHVIPYLKQRFAEGLIKSKVLNFIGIGESDLELKVKDFLQFKNPTVAPLAKKGEVSLRITAKGKTLKEVEEAIDKVEKGILSIVGEYHYGYDDEPIESVVGKQLIADNITFAVAESCTGGLICNKFTDVPGISKVFKEGIVAYSNEAKTRLLNVPQELLVNHGAVSSQVATAMAAGVRELAQTHIGLGVTGIAGPYGGSKTKPVGLVYIGLSAGNTTQCTKIQLYGSRKDIKERAAKYAINVIREYIKNSKN